MKLNLDFTTDLPDKWIPVEAVAIIRMLDEEGNPSLAVRTTSGLMPWDAIGMLIPATDAMRGASQELFRQGTGEE